VKLDQLLEAIETYLREQWKDEEWMLSFLLDPMSPWVSVDARRRHYFVGDGIPARVSFAMWKRTGAVHSVHGGAVVDPPLFEVA
jgi:hypothetical protein